MQMTHTLVNYISPRANCHRRTSRDKRLQRFRYLSWVQLQPLESDAVPGIDMHPSSAASY